MDIWPGIVTAYENIESDRKTKGETRAKVKGYLKKLRSYKFFQKVINFLDILDCIAPVSLVFEGEGLLPFEVAHVIAKLEVNLNYFECSESFDKQVSVSDSNDMTVRYLRMGHALKKPENREYINIPFDFMTYSKSDQDIVKDGAIELNSNLIRTIKERFEDFLGDTIFTSMKWFDPQYWEDSSDYGLEDINFIISHFKIPLEANGLNESKIVSEWQEFQVFAKIQYANFSNDPQVFWKKVLSFRRKEYPNLCLIVELVTCISGSNSAVEHCFNILTQVLTDFRLKSNDNTLQNHMIIKCNNKNWSDTEREQLLTRATEIYMSKHRKILTSSNEPAAKKIADENLQETQGTIESSSSSSSKDSD